MSNPFGNTAGPHRRPITPSEVRSVVFTTTRMRLGYDVEEVDAFLDQIEWSMEQMLAEINRLRRQIADIDQAHAASLQEARTTARRLVTLLGGSMPPTGMPPTPGAAYRPAMPPAPPAARRAANPAPTVWGGAPPGPPMPGPTVPGSVAGPPPAPPTAPPTGPPIAAPPPTGTPYADLPPPTTGPAAPGPGYFPPPQA